MSDYPNVNYEALETAVNLHLTGSPHDPATITRLLDLVPTRSGYTKPRPDLCHWSHERKFSSKEGGEEFFLAGVDNLLDHLISRGNSYFSAIEGLQPGYLCLNIRQTFSLFQTHTYLPASMIAKIAQLHLDLHYITYYTGPSRRSRICRR